MRPFLIEGDSSAQAGRINYTPTRNPVTLPVRLLTDQTIHQTIRECVMFWPMRSQPGGEDLGNCARWSHTVLCTADADKPNSGVGFADTRGSTPPAASVDDAADEEDDAEDGAASSSSSLDRSGHVAVATEAVAKTTPLGWKAARSGSPGAGIGEGMVAIVVPSAVSKTGQPLLSCIAIWPSLTRKAQR